jgi:hypothetical protein
MEMGNESKKKDWCYSFSLVNSEHDKGILVDEFILQGRFTGILVTNNSHWICQQVLRPGIPDWRERGCIWQEDCARSFHTKETEMWLKKSKAPSAVKNVHLEIPKGVIFVICSNHSLRVVIFWSSWRSDIEKIFFRRYNESRWDR